MFKNLFSNNKKQNKTTTTTNYMCSINFELNTDGTVNIVCYWPEFSENNSNTIEHVSKEYASLIFMITSGFFNSEILKTLDSLVNNNNPYDHLFISNILKNWAYLLDFEEKTEEPSVRPLMVFKHSTNPK